MKTYDAEMYANYIDDCMAERPIEFLDSSELKYLKHLTATAVDESHAEFVITGENRGNIKEFVK